MRNEENTSKLTSRFSNLSIWVNGNAITQDVEYSRKSKGLDWERGAGGPSDRSVPPHNLKMLSIQNA